MTELATLRRLRATNAKLMKGNLALLTAIRETDCAIEGDWRELQTCCALLEQNGLAMPASCLALMGTEDVATSRQVEVAHGPVDEAMSEEVVADLVKDEQESKAKARPTSSVLSVRSVLNAASSSGSDDDDNDNEDDDRSDSTEDSASDHGSAEEP